MSFEVSTTCALSVWASGTSSTDWWYDSTLSRSVWLLCKQFSNPRGFQKKKVNSLRRSFVQPRRLLRHFLTRAARDQKCLRQRVHRIKRKTQCQARRSVECDIEQPTAVLAPINSRITGTFYNSQSLVVVYGKEVPPGTSIWGTLNNTMKDFPKLI